MARFDTSGLDGVLDEMARLGQESGEAADEMLRAGAEMVREAWKRSAQEHGHRDTGDMIDSINYSHTVKKAGDVRMIDIYPMGKDRKGIRNAEKAFVLHYGTSKREGSHWVDDADRYSEETAIPAMIRIWENRK